MPFYHIVLFRLKPSAPEEVIDEFIKRAKAMETVPGVLKVDVNSPLAATANRANGYGLGIVAVLGSLEDLDVWAAHPAHLKAGELRDQLFEGSMSYDLEFPA
ncbi:uncharacterized protein F4822DRAFT_391021 [Hypoxylon trugodes]|uniref:uncharacterized protein n=1 Tax=Hypoxylon trugodes TaxID=326681 RepID=UPI0021905314|nr:uncharacterized protein F4822DRAFT_391021 [Hypoxylon trugodes]KAI1392427.1 hypothetical protein F4822DRAFT_391021 [Hypoxylon trugodes]